MSNWFYWLIKGIAWPAMRILFRFRRVGAERVPLEGACLVVANHTSYLDAICLGSASRRRLRFMVNAEIYDLLRLRWFYYMMRTIPLRINGADMGALRTAIQTLRSGGGVGIFPEGQRMEDGAVGEGKLGVAFLAYRSGAPVIPAAIIGAHKAMPVGVGIPRFLPIHVVFGEPLRFHSDSRKPGRRELEEFADRVMKAISDLGAPLSSENGAPLGTAEGGTG